MKRTEESTGDQHARATSSRLQSGAEGNEQTTDNDGPLAPDPICENEVEKQRNDAFDRLNGIKQTKLGSGRMTEICTRAQYS